MEVDELLFQETIDKVAVLALSEQDPSTPFPVVEYLDTEACQRWFIIKQNITSVGFYPLVWPSCPQIFMLFICPDFRRNGVGASAARLIISELLATHSEVSLSAIDNASYSFWSSTLDGFNYKYEGDRLLINDGA